MRTPVKEGHRSPIRSPASGSPTHKARAFTDQTSPGKGQGRVGRSRSPENRDRNVPSSPKRGKDQYDDDFEEATHDNVSSLEEEGVYAFEITHNYILP